MSQKQYAAFAANIKSWDALRQKKTNFVPGVLQVEKVILLSKADFDKLSEDISPDYPFLQNNRNLLSADPGGVFRCLMVREKGKQSICSSHSEGIPCTWAMGRITARWT